MDIKFYNRYTNKLETEKVYGGKWVNWLYASPAGKVFGELAAKKLLSKLYGSLQDSPSSKAKVAPFIKNFNINMDEFLPEEGRKISDPYSSFNKFFIRKFKPGKREFVSGEKFPAPAEARYFGFDNNSDEVTFPVKGAYLRAKDLIASSDFAKFENGPVVVARLCPVDYHRFHFPDDGNITRHYPVAGKLHSVNPIALQSRADIFITNERYVSILETKNFGTVAYIEVGATCVGKIVLSHDHNSSFKRGDEKGYFLFGGSTVIILGEAGKWKLSDDLRDNSKKGIETYLHLGDEMGVKV